MKQRIFSNNKKTITSRTTLNAIKRGNYAKNCLVKFLFSLFSFVIFSASPIFAQQNITYGVKGGLNISTLNYKNIGDEYKPRVSYHLGAMVNIPFSSKWALQPEALASKEGFNDNSSEQKWRILYFNVPVMLQYAIVKRLVAELGPEFGFRAKAQVSNSNNEFVNATTAYNQLNFSAAGGISYLSKYNVGISARYTKGLTDITQGSYNYVSTEVLQVSLFYLLKRSRTKQLNGK